MTPRIVRLTVAQGIESEIQSIANPTKVKDTISEPATPNATGESPGRLSGAGLMGIDDPQDPGW